MGEIIVKEINKYVIILLGVFSIIVAIMYVKSKIPNDKYHANVNIISFFLHIYIMEKLQ